MATVHGNARLARHVADIDDDGHHASTSSSSGTGPPGPPGADGEPGPPGPPGAKGDTGASGGATITTKDEGGTLSSTVTTLDFVGAGVTASGAGATTTITISGSGGGTDVVNVASGYGSVTIPGIGIADVVPASPNASNDEFDTTDTSDPMTGWTTLQTPTTHDISSTFRSHYYVTKTATAASTGHVGIYKAWTPSNGDTITCKVSDSVITSVNFQRAAMLWVSAASPGAMEVLHLVQDGNGPHIIVSHYTAPGTFGTNLGTLANGWIGSSMMPLYFRIVFNTSTSVDYLWSTNGMIYSPVVKASNPGYTLGAFGIGIEPAQTTHDGAAAFDWVRKNWTPGT